jgi:hypothetical protein
MIELEKSGSFPKRRPVVKPKTFPFKMLDQEWYWIKTDGCEYKILKLSEEDVIFAIDVCLANSSALRYGWAIEKHVSYDTTERARRWMLKRPVVNALMFRLVELRYGTSLARSSPVQKLVPGLS